MSTLASNHRNKLDANDINFIREFIDKDINVNIFKLSTCKTFECFELLMSAGYETKNIYDITIAVESWTLEEIICVVKYLMDDDALRSKFKLDTEIFYFASTITSGTDDQIKLFEMIAINYPWLKFSVQNCIRYHWAAEVLEPLFDFNSEQLVVEYLTSYNYIPITLLVRFCNPSDYLTKDVFQKIFRTLDIKSANYLLVLGYEITPESFPKTFWSGHTEVYDSLKELNQWNGETFDWENHDYKSATGMGKKFAEWLQKNHCPEHIIKKIALF
jgi:hypothetical protein